MNRSQPVILAAVLGIAILTAADGPARPAAEGEPMMPYSGTVACEETGRTLKDVQVRFVDSKTSVLTDVHGSFHLAAPTDTAAPDLVFWKPGYVVQELTLDAPSRDIQVRLIPKRLSAASHRWRGYIESESAFRTLRFEPDPAWSVRFDQSNLPGDFSPDPEMVRRDPSAVIQVGEQYYVYYTRGMRRAAPGTRKRFPWDQCDVWVATSTDGWNWKELGPAVERGPTGAFDDCSVFTPEVLAHDGAYYLVYQAVQAPYLHRVKNTIGMAVSQSPEGPWRKLPHPILRPTNNGQWRGTDDSPHAIQKGDFDSHKVHDPCLLHYRDTFYLYYKGERIGEERFFGQREIKWGVAIADDPEGPYEKSPFNPVTNSGHEVCVWPYRGGIALIHTDDGPEAGTVQWAPDGIHFDIMARAAHLPKAFGIFRTPDHDSGPLVGIDWGLCHTYGGGNWRASYNYIKRFDRRAQ